MSAPSSKERESGSLKREEAGSKEYSANPPGPSAIR